MDIFEAVEKRHSVRQYLDKPIEEEKISVLQEEIRKCNEESGLHIQLVTNEPKSFTGIMAHYGSFKNVSNYICLVGKKGKDLNEKLGYYGEKIVLLAQMLSLNTCWVAMTYNKRKCKAVVDKGEKNVIVISLGYGATQGHERKTKSFSDVASVSGDCPEWFRKGVECALKAPTATNQQSFRFALENGKVNAKATGGFYSDVDLGIVKYHFELGAGKENFDWA